METLRPSILAFVEKMDERLNEKIAEHGGDLWYFSSKQNEILEALVGKVENLIKLNSSDSNVKGEAFYADMKKILLDIANYSMIILEQKETEQWGVDDFKSRIDFAIKQTTAGGTQKPLNILLTWFCLFYPGEFKKYMKSNGVNKNYLSEDATKTLLKRKAI